MADVATATLARLYRLRDGLGYLSGQLDMLHRWAEGHGMPEQSEYLDNLAHYARAVACGCAAEAICDIAQTLPLRGLELPHAREQQRCGRPRYDGGACRTPVARQGDACYWHRETAA